MTAERTWFVNQNREYEIRALTAEEAWRKWMDSDWSTMLEEEPEVCTLTDDRGRPVEVD